MWLSILALFLSLSALCCCVWLFLALQGKLSSQDIQSKLQQSSEELSKTYAKSVRDIETEWDDMYLKFSRLAGRMDRNKAILKTENPPPEPVAAARRSDLLRKRREAAHE